MAVGQLLNFSFKKVIKFLDIFKNTFLINSSNHNENQVQKYNTKCKMHQSIPSIKQSASCNNFTFKVTVSQVIAELHEINSKKELDNLHRIPLKAL